MPQLDISTYSSQIFWLIICFVVLMVGSAKFLLPQLGTVFKERWRLIEGRLEEAKRLQAQAEEISFEFQKEFNFARKRAHEHIMLTSRQISKDMNKHRLDLSKISKEKFKASELRILEKKSSAMGHVQVISQELTSHLVDMVLKTPVSQGLVDAAVHSSISKIAANDF